jgi:hypothetical protein
MQAWQHVDHVTCSLLPLPLSLCIRLTAQLVTLPGQASMAAGVESVLVYYVSPGQPWDLRLVTMETGDGMRTCCQGSWGDIGLPWR